MILTVSGWRGWTDARFVIGHLSTYRMYGDQLFLRVGCCPTGADKIIRDWLTETRFPRMTVYYADWSLPGRIGGPIRNGQMLRGEANQLEPHPNVLTDKLLAFPQPGVKWRSPGSGTVGCIIEAAQLGVDLDIPGYKINTEERK